MFKSRKLIIVMNIVMTFIMALIIILINSYMKVSANALMPQIFVANTTIVSMTIAIVSILSASIKDEVYGLSISNFYFNEYYWTIKQKYILISLVFSIPASLIFWAINLFLPQLVIFFIVILAISNVLAINIRVFNGLNIISKDIENFADDYFNKNHTVYRYKDIYENTLLQITNENFSSVSTNVNYLTKFYIKITNERIIVDNDFKNEYIGILNTLYSKLLGDSSKLKSIGIDTIINLYSNFVPEIDIIEEGNAVFFEKQYFSLIGLLDSNLEIEEYFKKLLNLQNIMYSKLKGNNYGKKVICSFSSHLYYKIFNNKYIDDKERYYERLIQNLEFRIGDDEQEEELAVYELAILLKNMFLSDEFKYVKDFFNPYDLHYEAITERKALGYHSLIIFFYYLIEFENIVSNDEKIKYKNVLNELKNIGVIIFYTNNFLLNNDFKVKIEKFIGNWELFPADSNSKTLVMDSVIDLYFTFCIMEISATQEDLFNNLKKVFKDRTTSLLLMLNNNKASIANRYREFSMLFLNEKYLNEEINMNLENLYISLGDIEKRERFESIELINIEEELCDTKSKFENKIQEDIIVGLTDFIGEYANTKIAKIKKKVSYPLILQNNIHNYPFDFITTRITELLLSYSLTELANILYAKKRLNLVQSKNETDLLDDFFKLGMNKGEDDILIQIGFIRSFGPSFESYLMLKDQIKLYNTKANNIKYLIMLDSRSINFHNIEVKVDMQNEDINKIIEELEVTDDKYMFPIVNDIKIPYTYEEISKYLSSTRFILDVEFSMDVYTSEDVVGEGVFFKLDD